MGGSDHLNATQTVVRCLAGLSSLPPVHVVLGGAYAQRAELHREIAGRNTFVVHQDVPALVDVFAGAGAAIGAGGSTTWEMCCLGVAPILMTVADNQVGVATSLARLGAACYLGDFRDLTVHDVCASLAEVVSDKSRLRRIARNAAELVDGLGTQRVADEMMRRA
jgi:spore coat polysaccharide biosynthesis predicted glycosyltransferase SpsG